MDSHILELLRSRSAAIHVRWETLLRLEPVSGPLANPDALVRLIPESLAEIFDALSSRGPAKLTLTTTKAARLPDCQCGCNPYLAYFIAAERAFVETLVLIQAELPANPNHERDVAQLIRAVRRLGGSEIDTFCGVCSHRCEIAKCRFTAAPTAN